MTLKIPPPDLRIERRLREDQPITHRLKCWSKYFIYSWSSYNNYGFPTWKPFEIRRMDRDYRQGDKIHIYEFNPVAETFSGRHMEGEIRDVITNAPGIEADYGIILIRFLAHVEHYPEAKI